MRSRAPKDTGFLFACVIWLAACGTSSPSSTPPATGSGAGSQAPSATPSASPVSSDPSVAFPLDIVDAEGKSHHFNEPVTSVGCGNYLCLDTLADLGVVATGVSTADEGEYNDFYYPHGVPALVDIDAWNPEAWARAEAEIILVRVAEPDDREKALEAVADVVYLYAPAYSRQPPFGSEAGKENLRLVGAITGRIDEAQTAIERYDRIVSALQAEAPGGELPTVLLAQWFEGVTYALPKEDAVCAELEEALIATCPDFAAGYDIESGEISQEALLAIDPDWIVYQSFDPSDVAANVDDATWDRLTAVKEGRVFDVDARWGAYSTGLRGTTWFLPVVARKIWGDDAGVPDPGDLKSYDPAENPLLGG